MSLFISLDYKMYMSMLIDRSNALICAVSMDQVFLHLVIVSVCKSIRHYFAFLTKYYRKSHKRSKYYISEHKSRTRGQRAFLRTFLFPFYKRRWKNELNTKHRWMYLASILWGVHILISLRFYWAKEEDFVVIDALEFQFPFLLLAWIGVLFAQAAMYSESLMDKVVPVPASIQVMAKEVKDARAHAKEAKAAKKKADVGLRERVLKMLSPVSQVSGKKKKFFEGYESTGSGFTTDRDSGLGMDSPYLAKHRRQYSIGSSYSRWSRRQNSTGSWLDSGSEDSYLSDEEAEEETDEEPTPVASPVQDSKHEVLDQHSRQSRFRKQGRRLNAICVTSLPKAPSLKQESPSRSLLGAEMDSLDRLARLDPMNVAQHERHRRGSAPSERVGSYQQDEMVRRGSSYQQVGTVRGSSFQQDSNSSIRTFPSNASISVTPSMVPTLQVLHEEDSEDSVVEVVNSPLEEFVKEGLTGGVKQGLTEQQKEAFIGKSVVNDILNGGSIGLKESELSDTGTVIEVSEDDTSDDGYHQENQPSQQESSQVNRNVSPLALNERRNKGLGLNLEKVDYEHMQSGDESKLGESKSNGLPHSPTTSPMFTSLQSTLHTSFTNPSKMVAPLIGSMLLESETETETLMNNTFTNTPEKSLFRTASISHVMGDMMDSVKGVSWNQQGGPRKVELSPPQIRAAITKKVDAARPNVFYERLAVFSACVTALIPSFYRIYFNGGEVTGAFSQLTTAMIDFTQTGQVLDIWDALEAFVRELAMTPTYIFGRNTASLETMAMIHSAVCTGVLTYLYFIAVAVAEDTYRRRFLYAKYFGKLTSSRRARKAQLPHFRLYKIDNIRVWLSLRSRKMDMDRYGLGIYKSSDTTANSVVMAAIVLVTIMSIKLLFSDEIAVKRKYKSKDNDLDTQPMFDSVAEWQLVFWFLVHAIYAWRFIQLTQKTAQKYNSRSVLLTEQLNVHMKIFQKPHKKAELAACNAMIKTCMDLIPELEGGGKASKKGGVGPSPLLNPLVFSFLKMVILSAIGAMSSDVLGFKVRLWKLGS